MIQRIQSLYILAATALLVLVVFFPLASFAANGEVHELSASGILKNGELLFSTWPLLILCLSACILSVTALFLYKKRLLQIRFLVFAIILQLGIYGLGAYYILQLRSGFSDFSFAFSAILPLLSSAFTFMAIKAIGRDEALVKSLDRIR